MRYPPLLRPGDTIGVCAPSSGMPEPLHPRLGKAIANVRALGYEVIETPSVRTNRKCVSADSATRAAEFMSLYENPSVRAILPPWGGEFLMDMLPHLDFERISRLPPKWVCGYSDMSLLCFALTVGCDVATVHGSNLANLGYRQIDPHDLRLFDALSQTETTQHSAAFWGGFRDFDDLDGEVYTLDRPGEWKLLSGGERASAQGRLIGGCLDVLCKVISTRFADVPAFLSRYPGDRFLWALESCEMSAADIYRTLWQMDQCGWFERISGVIVGRPDGYSDTRDFTHLDALQAVFGGKGVPVIHGADIGHIPPQMQIVNGTEGSLTLDGGRATLITRLRA